MNILKTRQEIRTHLERSKGKTIGFVATMGALHQGHLSLVEQSKETTDITLVSIFVNPTQFNDPRDLKAYPQNLKNDLALLDDILSQDDIVFMPAVEEIYKDEKPPDINLEHFDKVMEGKYRPGHFDGVVRVVSILFNIIMPDVAFFGQKDFQQLAIIREMVKQLGLKIQIISCPIIRERNGLAMSSRNERLEPELRQKAGIIFNTLNQNHKVETHEDIKQIIEEVVQKIDSVDELQTQYFVIVDGTDLKPLEAVTDIDPGKKYFGCIAVFAGEIRLIDNVEFSFPVSKG